MDSTAPRIAAGRPSERGFTLAAVIVLVTIVMIFATYTVPRQWSAVLQRDRERQTIFVMQQYAKSIDAFEAKNHALPVSIDQLKQARAPRFIRGPKSEYVDPLTGDVDWLIVPQSAGGIANRGPGYGPPATAGPTPGAGPSGPQPVQLPGIPIKDYAGGPFVGVRPNKNGNSLLSLNGATRYEQWIYTVNDYRAEKAARLAAAARIWQ